MNSKSKILNYVIVVGQIINIKLLVFCLSDYNINNEEKNRSCLQNVDSNLFMQENNSTSYLCITNSSHLNLTENSFSNFSNLNILLLMNVSIVELPLGIFNGLNNLIKLDLSDNKLESLHPSTFINCTNLRILILRNNNINRLESVSQSLLPLHQLNYLDLNQNNIMFVETEYLTSSLEILKLGNCKLKQMIFSSLLNLKKLYLNNNQLTPENFDFKNFKSSSLQELYLGNEKNIESTDFNQNYFIALKENFLNFFSNLTVLDLRNSGISYIAPHSFEEFDQLKELNLSANNLLSIPSAVLSLQTLEKLDMSFNSQKGEMFVIYTSEINFNNMTSLQILNLSNNVIVKLKSVSFAGLKNLKHLSLKFTQLQEIKPYSFSGLKSLQYLDLSNNFLSEIENFTFWDLDSLVHIDLSHNNLKIYPHNHPFLSLRSLQKIEFQHNSLCELWPWLIVDLLNLTYLDMSYNKIVGWRWRAFPTSNSLKNVNLQSNEIKTISEQMLEDLMTLEYGNFTNNPYNCADCEIINLQKWLSNFTIESEKYYCLYTYRGEMYAWNSTIPSWCYASTSYYNYIPLGISLGIIFLLIFIVGSIAYSYRWYLQYRWYITRCHLKNWHKPLQRKKSWLYDAFISYCDKDRYWVKEELLPRLETRFRFCVHERDFEAGKNITDNIFEGIDKSKMFIAIITEDFLQSQWCMWELNMAISKMAVEQQDSLVLIKLHTISKEKMSRNVQYLIKTKTYLGWPVTAVGQRLFWERLIHILQKRVSLAAVKTDTAS